MNERESCFTCNKCGTVAFGVTREFAEAEVKRFNEYYEKLSPQKQQDYYGGTKSSLRQYERCGCGNPHTNFRAFKEGDCPDGCTLGPIIREDHD